MGIGEHLTPLKNGITAAKGNTTLTNNTLGLQVGGLSSKPFLYSHKALLVTETGNRTTQLVPKLQGHEGCILRFGAMKRELLGVVIINTTMIKIKSHFSVLKTK